MTRKKPLLLGYDIGSSAIKASVIDAVSGKVLAAAVSPQGSEMPITSLRPGWAEQHPETWWEHVILATRKIGEHVDFKHVLAIGISYQMHGLVLIDENHKVLRPSIIWCDSRAVKTGNQALGSLGVSNCYSRYLNAPGNFTASKLKWVKDQEPELYKKICKMMLPGDYIAMKLTGKINTTVQGLSESILWDYNNHTLAHDLLNYYEINPGLIPDLIHCFSNELSVTQETAGLLGINPGIKVSYRAGDQPNNAFSLNVLEPGEVAATAGTSGVVFGVTGSVKRNDQSGVNIFAHVNHREDQPRYGLLLCINGAGIANSWLRKHLNSENGTYEEMNRQAAEISAGAEGLMVFPFGNGSERMFNNQDLNAHFHGLNFNRHHQGHFNRAVQEGVAFAFHYGLKIFERSGIEVNTIKAGHANLFLSNTFREAFVNTTAKDLEIYNTDGAQGAARGAGIGAGIYATAKEAFEGLEKISRIRPDPDAREIYYKLYQKWENTMQKLFEI